MSVYRKRYYTGTKQTNTILNTLYLPRTHYRFKFSTKHSQVASRKSGFGSYPFCVVGRHGKRHDKFELAGNAWLLTLPGEVTIWPPESASRVYTMSIPTRLVQFKGIIHKKLGHLGLTKPGETPLGDVFKANVEYLYFQTNFTVIMGTIRLLLCENPHPSSRSYS